MVEGIALPLAASDFGNGMIIILIALVVLPIAALAFASSGAALKTLGKGRFAIEQELPAKRTLGPPPPVDPAVHAAEVRQMLEAKSYRRQRRGEAPLDIEEEMKLLLAPAPAAPASHRIDSQLREEVRQLVIARNERRMRQGKPPLDVKEEIERQLADLDNLGQ
jgi:hypothetical protein